VTQLWSLIILALHVALPTGLSRDTVELRAIVQNQLVVEATISRDGTGRFLLRSPSEFLPVVIEQSRIHSQVYTIFAPWQPNTDSLFTSLDDPEIQSELGSGSMQDRILGSSLIQTDQSDQIPQNQYASGSYPPLIVDLTPVFLQQNFTRQGRYTVQWSLPQSVELSTTSPLSGSMSHSNNPSHDLELNILFGSRDLSIFAPGAGMMIQVTFP
jgi:hypothetical protein